MRIFKQIIIIIFVLVLVISLDIITRKITKEAIENIKEELSILEKNIKTGSDGIIEETEQLDKKWKSIEDKLSFYLEHNELEKISIKIKLLKKEIEIDELNDAKETIMEINYSLEHVEEKQNLKIKNIF